MAVVLAIIGVMGVAILYRSDLAGGGAVTVLPGVTRIQVDAVDRITVTRAGEATMIFKRTPDGWMQVEPLSFPVESFSLRQFAVQATGLQVVRTLEPGDGVAVDVGLDDPRAIVTWSWPAGSYTLAFGRRSVGGRSYVQPAGDETVYVVTGDLYERAVEMNPWEWRDRVIFAPPPAEIDAIRIDDATRRIVLQRQGKRWLMTEPVQTRVDPVAADALLSMIRRARSGGFILDGTEDLARFGLTNPSGRLTVNSGHTVADGDTVRVVEREDRLLVGSRMGVGSQDRFGMVEGRDTVVRVPDVVLAAFFPSVVALVDPTPSGVLPADVKSIVIRRRDGELRLQRDLERWRAPDLGADADAATVERFLRLLTETRAVEVELTDEPLHSAAGQSITFHGFDGRPMETVRFGMTRPSGPSSMVMDNGDNVWRILPRQIDIPLTADRFGIEISAATQAPD